MFNKLKNAGKWIKAVKHFENGNNEQFLSSIELLDSNMNFSIYQLAMIATSKLILGRYNEAEKDFNIIISKIERQNDDNSQYIKLYCLARLDGMKGNLGFVALREIEARKLNCKQLYRDRLPIK